MILFAVKLRLRRIGLLPRSFWRRVWLLLLIAAGLVVVGAILWAAVAEPAWLLPDTRGLSPAERVKAQTDFRNTAVTLLGGFAVLVGGAVGAANLVLSQRVQWRAQVTDRFGKAIEQLGQQGPDKLDVRIGAVYALEQIARDSADLHWPIMEVLTAYLRQHSPAEAAPADVLETPPSPMASDVPAPDPAPGGTTSDGTNPAARAPRKRIPADHQAMATVIGRRRREQGPDGHHLDLSKTDLSGVLWSRAHLEEMDLYGANLEGAFLREAHLEGADLQGANLERAFLREAHLAGANLERADLSDANLTWEQLQNAAGWDGARLPAELAARLGEAAGTPSPPPAEPLPEAPTTPDPD